MKNKQKLKGMLSKQDLEAISDLMGGLLDKQAAVLASKKDLEGVKNELKGDMAKLETNLKYHMNQGFESVMEGMDNLTEKLAEREKVERLIQWAKEVGIKVGVKPKI
jgi:hypothetical protein